MHREVPTACVVMEQLRILARFLLQSRLDQHGRVRPSFFFETAMKWYSRLLVIFLLCLRQWSIVSSSLIDANSLFFWTTVISGEIYVVLMHRSDNIGRFAQKITAWYGLAKHFSTGDRRSSEEVASFVATDIISKWKLNVTKYHVKHNHVKDVIVEFTNHGSIITEFQKKVLGTDLFRRYKKKVNRKPVSSERDNGLNVASHPKNRRFKLVYQVDPIKNMHSMSEWIEELLGPPITDIQVEDSRYAYEVIFDAARFSYIPPENDIPIIVVYESKDCENAKTPLLKYLLRLDAQSIPYGVLVLHDEAGSGCQSHFPMSRVVLTNVGYTHFLDLPQYEHVFPFMIGYHNGMKRTAATPLVPILERNFTWSAIMDINKAWRRQMNSSMSKVPNGFTHYTQKWNDLNYMSPKDYIEVMRQSVFAPIPFGNIYPTHTSSEHNQYRFDEMSGYLPNAYRNIRLFEALEHGTIPIIENFSKICLVENKSYQDGVIATLGRYGLTDHIPIPSIEDWHEAPELIEYYTTYLPISDLYALQQRVLTWYEKQKEVTKIAMRKHLLKYLWRPAPARRGDCSNVGFMAALYNGAYSILPCEVDDFTSDAL